MSDLLERVYEHVKAHPGANIDSTANEIRKPRPQVEACFDRLRRERRICQPLPGHWYAGHNWTPLLAVPIHADRPVLSKAQAETPKKAKWVPPPGPRLCKGCNTVKQERDFAKGSTKCRTCRSAYHKAWREAIHGKPTPASENSLQRRFVKNQRAA